MIVEVDRKELEEMFRDVQGHIDYEVNPFGDVRNKRTKRILKPYTNSSGLLKVTLDGEKCYIHKLVAEAFVANPENRKYVNHEDHNLQNNFFTNLIWSNNYIYDRSKNSP